MTSEIPVIDVSGLASPDIADRRATAGELGRACEDVGFLTIVGHGFPDDLRAAAFDQTRRLFALPLAEKMAKAWDDEHMNRGYDPLASQRLEEGTPPDLKEAWAFSPEQPAGSTGSLPARGPMQGENQWPDLPGFRDPIVAYHHAAMDLCARLMRAMALALDLPEHHFEPFHRAPTCTLRLLHYPPRTGRSGELGAGAHTDWGAVTVLAQDDAGSLQVRARDGAWIDVPPIDGSLVVNVGDLLQRWTNDRYVSTMHRVLGTDDRDRYSIACFFDLDDDATIECLSTCTGVDRPARYPAIRAGDHLRERYEASLG